MPLLEAETNTESTNQELPWSQEDTTPLSNILLTARFPEATSTTSYMPRTQPLPEGKATSSAEPSTIRPTLIPPSGEGKVTGCRACRGTARFPQSLEGKATASPTPSGQLFSAATGTSCPHHRQERS